jgi:DNA polymerase-3 subunit beta
MKITVTHLAAAMQQIKAVIGNEKTMPILGHIHIETADDSIVLTASDLQTELKIKLPAEIHQPGAACLHAHKLGQFAKIAGETPIIITVGDNNTKLKAKSRSTINTLPTADFPVFKQDALAEPITINIDSETLANGIRKTQICAGKNDVRYYLNGIYFQQTETCLRLTASNGHMLGTLDIHNTAEQNKTQHCIISIKTAVLIEKIFNKNTAIITFNQNQLTISNDTTTLTCKTIDAKYPDISTALNTPKPLETELNSKQLIETIESVLITSPESKAVTISVSNNQLTATSRNAHGEESTDNTDCINHGDDYEMAFCADYLTAAAGQISGNIIINTNGNQSLTMQPVSKDFIYLIMPMRL